MILNCAIVDDEPLALNLLESYINKTPFLNLVGKYSSAVQAMNEISNKNVQLLFLDIQMPNLNGVEFSKMVDRRIRIIFTTAFSEYALDGYRVNALDYLLKPISYADFLEASNKALQWFILTNQSENEEKSLSTSNADVDSIDSIFVKSEYKLVQILLDDILYIEGLKDYIKIYTADNVKPTMSLMTMKSIEELLPTNKFMRVHRSFIVQKKKIQVIDRNRIVFGKTYIPISETYKEEFMEFLKKRSS